MKAKELRQCGIKIEKIDNGYRVPKTLKYTKCDDVITVDKDDYFGLKSYVMEVNGKDVTNFLGKTLRWENLEDVSKDVLRIFNGDMPIYYFTYA